MRYIATVLFLGLAAVGCSDELAAEGEECSTSAECGAGLFCDTTQDPSICVRTGGPRPDLAGADLSGMDLAGLDLAGADLSAVPVDMSQSD